MEHSLSPLQSQLPNLEYTQEDIQAHLLAVLLSNIDINITLLYFILFQLLIILINFYLYYYYLLQYSINIVIFL